MTSSILYRESEKAKEIRLEKAAQVEVTETEQHVTTQTSEEVLEVLDNQGENPGFLVLEEDGYLVIYDRLTMQQYDETTIQLYDLPERLQEEVRKGLYFLNEEALYAFLENYSS